MFPLKQPYIEVRALFGDSVDIFWWNGNITEYLEEKFFAIWRDGENITGGMRDEGENCWRDTGWRPPPRAGLYFVFTVTTTVDSRSCEYRI